MENKTRTTTLPSLSDCSMCARLGFGVLGIVLGVANGVVFAASYHNIHVAVWSFLSAAVSAITLYTHVMHVKGSYVKSTSQLRTFMYLGCLTQIAAACCCALYVALAVYERQGFLLQGPGYVPAAVWCVLTLTLGFQLFYFSRAYCRSVNGETDPLLPAKERPPVNKDDVVRCSIQV